MLELGGQVEIAKARDSSKQKLSSGPREFVLKKGRLIKQRTASGFGMHERFFVMTTKRLLYYSSQPQKQKRARGECLLDYISGVEKGEDGLFDVIFANGGRWRLKSDDPSWASRISAEVTVKDTRLSQLSGSAPASSPKKKSKLGARRKMPSLLSLAAGQPGMAPMTAPSPAPYLSIVGSPIYDQ
mmetsp:Transcript_39127/g.84810  ORF Transcript_39127/g.84810 Transcript_39127/m.84810 type:complete len:185 (+) Transcript_39127:31-585(+)